MLMHVSGSYYEFEIEGFIYRCVAKNVIEAKEMCLKYVSEMIDLQISIMLSDHCSQKEAMK